jgi:hypothetical protein
MLRYKYCAEMKIVKKKKKVWDMKVRKVCKFLWIMTGTFNRGTLCGETNSPLDSACEL